MAGFSDALKGPPVDGAAYKQARLKLANDLMESRKKAVEEFRRENKELQLIVPKGQGAPAVATPAATPAPAAKKP